MTPHSSLDIIPDILAVQTDTDHRNSRMYETCYCKGVTAKVTWDFFLIEFRKKYINYAHEEEQNRMDGQQRRDLG